MSLVAWQMLTAEGVNIFGLIFASSPTLPDSLGR